MDWLPFPPRGNFPNPPIPLLIFTMAYPRSKKRVYYIFSLLLTSRIFILGDVTNSSHLNDDIVTSINVSSLANKEGADEVVAKVNANDTVINRDTDNTVETEISDEEKAIPSHTKRKETASLPKSGINTNQNAPNYDEEQTYLDLFGERAKELLTQHIIPPTDAKCRWDWKMGRCEPYCECGYYFLWGDYHIGRSCRLRSKFAPDRTDDDVKRSSESLQEAWQQWADHMDDPEAFASFVDSGNKAKKSADEVDQCSLPPESRYTQAVYYFTKVLGHGTFVFHQFQKVKKHAVKLTSAVLIHGKHRFHDGRDNVCVGLKKMIKVRERERDQPVILTKRGMIWIRRICGTKNDASVYDSEDDPHVVDCNQEGQYF